MQKINNNKYTYELKVSMSLLSFGDTLPIIISTIEREWVYKRVLILIQ